MQEGMMAAEPAQFLAKAFAAFSANRWSETIELCHQVLAIDSDNRQAHLLWASAELHGNDYLHILKRIHRHQCPGTYVEIGVETGLSLALADRNTSIIGIDPSPQLSHPAPEGARIFRETSDEFFAQHDLCKELGGRPVDLAFIDGMHLFEFVLRDFVNLEQYCVSTSTCLVHDCYPLDERTSGRDRVTEFWTGDVWKLILCLKKYRPDIDVHTVAAGPTGLAVIRRLDPKSRILRDRMDSICDEFASLPYSALHGDKAGQLNLVANNWLTVKALLRADRSDPTAMFRPIMP
jgi:methyltransferase family protein